jgi:two-component system nitrate/nitrite response regulator NarL
MSLGTRSRGTNGRTQRPGVLVCDAQPPFRRAIEFAIRGWPEFRLLGSVCPGQLSDELARLKPDVAVVDQAGFRAEPAVILAEVPATTRIVFFSEHQDSEMIYSALAGGAVAYLAKTASPREVCHAIAAAARDEPIIAPSVHPMLAASLQAREPRDGPLLSPRERQVLGLLAEGLTIPEAARRLGLRPSTVQTHVENLTESLGVHGQKAALVAAMRAGLIE